MDIYITSTEQCCQPRDPAKDGLLLRDGNNKGPTLNGNKK
jgi:hypothetical protein